MNKHQKIALIFQAKNSATILSDLATDICVNYGTNKWEQLYKDLDFAIDTIDILTAFLQNFFDKTPEPGNLTYLDFWASISYKKQSEERNEHAWAWLVLDEEVQQQYKDELSTFKIPVKDFDFTWQAYQQWKQHEIQMKYLREKDIQTKMKNELLPLK